jgi:outer membrane protein assembly factor BamB
MKKITCTRLLALLFSLTASLNAADWPHWLGPNGDNKVAASDNFDPDLNKWKIAWQKNVGLGYSTVTSAEGKAYTMGHDGKSSETISCFDAITGKKIWDYTYEGDLIPSMHVGGPNASVTISGDHIYAVSKDGQVFCLKADSGEKVWNSNLTKILALEVPKWGFGSSPVEYKGDILISAGKTVALDKTTGRPSWISKESYDPGYGTPIVFKNGNKDYIATMDGKGLSILEASNGTEVARYAQSVRFGMNATTPTPINDGKQIFFHSNSNTTLLAFDGKSLTPEWGDRKLQNALSGSVLLGGQVYGLSGDHKNRKTILYSRDLETGQENWNVPNYGFASLIAVGDTLLILTEDGELVTASANNGKYTEISRKKLLNDICWTHPTYANGQIYIRNDQGVLICLERA